MQNNPQPYEVYRHFKGNMYQVLCIATDSENGQKMVVYQQLYQPFSIYVRPYDMFISPVDKNKYPDVLQHYRFELVKAGLDAKTVKTQQEAKTPQQPEIPQQPETPQQPEKLNGPQEPKQPNQQEQLYDAQEIISEEDDMPEVNPMLIRFLDADTYSRKLEILAAMQTSITHEMINAMAASLEIEVEETDIESRYEAIKNSLLTLERFECNRLR